MTNWRVFGFMAKERVSPERLLSRWSIDLFREHNRLFGTHTVIFPVNMRSTAATSCSTRTRGPSSMRRFISRMWRSRSTGSSRAGRSVGASS